jgi:hypothetical protein
VSVWGDWASGWREGLRRGLAQSGRALLALAERVAPPSDTSDRQDRSDDDATGGGSAAGGPPPGGPPPHWLARLPPNEPPADWLARVQGQMLEEGQADTAEFDKQPAADDSALATESMAEEQDTAVSPPDNQPTVQPKRPSPNFPPRRARTRPLRFRWPDRPPRRPATASAETSDSPLEPTPARANFPVADQPEQRPRLHFVAWPDANPPASPAFPPAAAPAPAERAKPAAPPVRQKSAAEFVGHGEETAVFPPAAPSFPDRSPLAGEPVQSRRESEGSRHAEPVDRTTERLADMPTPPRPRPPAPRFPDRPVPPAPVRPRWPDLPTSQRPDPTWPPAFQLNRSTRDTSSGQRDTGRDPNLSRSPAWPEHSPSAVHRPPSFPPAETADRWPTLPDEITPASNEWEQSRRRWQDWRSLTQEQEGEAWNGSSS